MSREKWIASIMTLAVIDVYAAYVKNDGTLSQATRQTFRTDTNIGKVVWVGSWCALSAWLMPHIWHIPIDIIDEIS